ELRNYYETNIEQYVAPDDVFDELEKEAEDTSAGDETTSDEEQNTEEAGDDTSAVEKDSTDEPTAGNSEGADNCLTLLPEEAEDAPKEPTIDSEPATDAPPAEGGEKETDSDASADDGANEGEAPATEGPEDLSGLDTPIPLEPNIIPAPPKTYKPYDEVVDEVREAYIRTSKFEKKKQLLDAAKQTLLDAMNDFSDGDSGNGQARSVRLADALDKGQQEIAKQIMSDAEVELARVLAEINNSAAGVLTEAPETADGEETVPGEPIVLVVSGNTNHTSSNGEMLSVISAAYGQAISGRNPDAADFGLPWDDSTPSWVKMVRVAYQAHGGPGSTTNTDLFLDSDFLIPHETDSFQNATYVFWQVEQTEETPFEAGLSNTTLRRNVIQSWKKMTALTDAQADAKAKAESYIAGENKPLREVIDEIPENASIYTTFPTSMFRLSQFNLQQGGVELGTLQKSEVVVEMVNAPQEQASEEEADDPPEQIERSELRPTVTISDISDGAKLTMFEEMKVNSALSFTAPTGRKVYIVRKIDYQPSSDTPSLPMDFFAPADFEQLVKYLADGRVPAGGGMAGMASITMGPTALATDNMYRSQQGGGTVTQLSQGFIALLQKQYNYTEPQAIANQ
ncbi:MAG: hypothetical protein VX776_04870, partial [Planctomycetota bacterium]|nr:hypothetical protein [Planctomycetota bacterium]